MNTVPRPTRRAVPILLFALAACASTGGPTGTTPSEPEPSQPIPSASPMENDTARPVAPAGIPDALWAAILDDLERRLGAPMADPTVVTAEARTWNDGSLGCPVAGQMYTQALVDGYQVIVEVRGERYDYRAAGGTDVRLCAGGPIEGG